MSPKINPKTLSPKDAAVGRLIDEAIRGFKESERLTMEERAVLAAAMSLADAPAIINDPNGFRERMRFLRAAVDAYRDVER